MNPRTSGVANRRHLSAEYQPAHPELPGPLHIPAGQHTYDAVAVAASRYTADQRVPADAIPTDEHLLREAETRTAHLHGTAHHAHSPIRKKNEQRVTTLQAFDGTKFRELQSTQHTTKAPRRGAGPAVARATRGGRTDMNPQEVREVGFDLSLGPAHDRENAKLRAARQQAIDEERRQRKAERKAATEKLARERRAARRSALLSAGQQLSMPRTASKSRGLMRSVATANTYS